jgi:uncharacterized protein involved in oxidation of intracellular sulfur
MKTLLILNEPPYGTERSYNGLRLAGSLAKRDDQQVRVFLMGDAAGCAKAGQVVPPGFYNLSRMLQVVVQHRGDVGVCGSCMDARGLADTELLAGAHRSSMDQLTDWTLWADRILVF